MENNQNDGDGPRQQLRSMESIERAYVRFVNLTNTTIEILWVNYMGQYVRYQLLRCGSYVDVDTYKTHPWMALDVFTKDRMLLDKQYVYMPKTTREHLINNNPNLINPAVPQERRKFVYITLPLYSLRYRTLLAVRNFFKTTDEVNSLGLPQSLSQDLKNVISLRNQQMNLPVITASHGI